MIFSVGDSVIETAEPTKKDWIKTIILIVVFMVILVLGAIFLLPDLWIIWLIIIVFGLFLLVGWHAKSTAYRCNECKYEFEISFLKDFFSPHWVGKEGARKYLKCPKCKKRTGAKILVKTTENE